MVVNMAPVPKSPSEKLKKALETDKEISDLAAEYVKAVTYELDNNDYQGLEYPLHSLKGKPLLEEGESSTALEVNAENTLRAAAEKNNNFMKTLNANGIKNTEDMATILRESTARKVEAEFDAKMRKNVPEETTAKIVDEIRKNNPKAIASLQVTYSELNNDLEKRGVPDRKNAKDAAKHFVEIESRLKKMNESVDSLATTILQTDAGKKIPEDDAKKYAKYLSRRLAMGENKDGNAELLRKTKETLNTLENTYNSQFGREFLDEVGNLKDGTSPAPAGEIVFSRNDMQAGDTLPKPTTQGNAFKASRVTSSSIT